MYHSIGRPEAGDRMGLKVASDTFAEHVMWLRHQGWKIVTVGELIRFPKKGHKQVAISFDDGYDDQLAAARHLNEQGLRGTFFLITGKPGLAIGGKDYYRNWKLMDRTHWQELADQGHEIGGHSHQHPGPLTLQPSDCVAKDIDDCRSSLQAGGPSGKPGFSYPHGAWSPAIGRAVETAGFDYACGSRPGSLAGRLERFYLPRIEISGRDSMEDFQQKVEGRGEIWRVLRHDLMRAVWRMQGRV